MSTLRVKELKSINSGPISIKSDLVISGTVTVDDIIIGPTRIPVTGCCVNILNVTYETLRLMMNQNLLQKGFLYKIVNFRTCYDQAEIDVTGVVATSTGGTRIAYYHTAPIDPIIVLATSTNTIDSNVFQPSYPKDVLKYDVYYDTTEFTQSKARGRIIERIDEYKNRTDYDHRTILFRRYFHFNIDHILTGKVTLNPVGSPLGTVTGTGCDFVNELSVGTIVKIGAWDYEVTSISGPNNMIVQGIYYDVIYDTFIYATIPGGFNRYGKNNLISYTNTFIERLTFRWDEEIVIYGEVLSKNNYIGNSLVYYIVNDFEDFGKITDTIPVSTKNIESITITSTTQILSSEINKIGGITFNLLINEITGTTIEYLNVLDNNIVSGITYNVNENSYESKLDFDNVDILPYFIDTITGTTITNLLSNIRLGISLISGTTINNLPYLYFYPYYSNNVFGIGCHSNYLSNYSKMNTFGDFCENNTFGESAQKNIIGELSQYNKIGKNADGNVFYGASFNEIDHNFSSNWITGNFVNNEEWSFRYNRIGLNFANNLILKSNFAMNNISNEFNSNRINQVDFRNNDIESYFYKNIVNTTIRNYFSGGFNDFAYFRYNKISMFFMENNIQRFDFNYNTIGISFNKNSMVSLSGNTIFSSLFYSNNIDSFFRENKINVTNFNFNNVMSYLFRNDIISSNFTNNLLGRNFSFNRIEASNFTYNEFKNEVYGNSILTKDNFNLNTILTNAIFNVITGNDFNENKIDDYFQYNNIYNNFISNKIGYNFKYNTIFSIVDYNTIGDRFEWNRIEYITMFKQNNLLGKYYSHNIFGSGNIINNVDLGSTIISPFYFNVISGAFSDNKIMGSSFKFNNFINTTVRDVIFNKSFDFNNFVTGGTIIDLTINSNLFGVNFSNSTYIYNTTPTKEIFTNSFGDKKIGFYDGTNTFITANVNA